MNYPVRDGLIDYLMGEGSVDDLSTLVDLQLNQYSHENVYAMYNLLGSHDTPRIKTKLEGDQKKLKMAYLFMFAFPGAPAIYYGDEIGLDGEKDPDCRKAFPWDEVDWDHKLRQLIHKLISIRKKNPALRRGSYQEVFKDSKRGGYGFARVLGDENLLAVMNASGTRRQFKIIVDALTWQDGRIVHDVINGEEMIISGNELSLTLEAWSSAWIV
jgi:glycosidase